MDISESKHLIQTLEAIAKVLENILECERKTLEALEINRQLLEMMIKRPR